MNIMKYFLTASLILLLFLAHGCGLTGTEESSSDAPSIADIEGQDAVEIPSDQEMAIPALSPEDQKKADSAPAGMTFIKGRCFTMGNDNAQADESKAAEFFFAAMALDSNEPATLDGMKRLKKSLLGNLFKG